MAMLRHASHREEAEVHDPTLPWQEFEGALLLLLVKRAQQLQLHLSMLRHKPRILLQDPSWHVSHWDHSLHRHVMKNLSCAPGRAQSGGVMTYERHEFNERTT